MRSIQCSIVAGTLSGDPREAPQLSREMGFAGMQFDAYGPSLRIPDLSGTGRREFRQLLSGQNQQLVGLRVDLGSKGFGPGADVDRLLHGLDRALEAAVGLIAPLVCIDLGSIPEPERTATPPPKITPKQAGLILLPESFAVPAIDPVTANPPPDAAFVSQVEAALGELGELADRYSVVLAFRTDLSSFAAIDRTLRSVRCPWFGVDFDPAAALRDEWSMDEIFSRLGSDIRHVRGRDAIGGVNHRTKPAIVGRGDIQWDQLLANLDAAGYAGWITLDPVELPDRLVAAAQGLKHVRAIS